MKGGNKARRHCVAIFDKLTLYSSLRSSLAPLSKRANPIWFDGEFGVDIVREWRRGGSLFGRKFREVKGDVWRRVVAQVEREEEGETKNGPSKG